MLNNLIYLISLSFVCNLLIISFDYLDELAGYNCEAYFLGVELSLQALKQSYTILDEKHAKNWL